MLNKINGLRATALPGREGNRALSRKHALGEAHRAEGRIAWFDFITSFGGTILLLWWKGLRGRKQKVAGAELASPPQLRSSALTDLEAVVKPPTYAGLFMVTLATLMHEILLTRIFSVTMWYHFAFMAISVALFGMTVGAILVYLLPAYFTEERTHDHLALSAWLFAISIVISFLTYASIPFVMGGSLVAVYSIALSYVVISVPFVFSGICVSLALTRFPRHVGRLYATDLAGAACGCVLVIAILRVTDGPGAVMVAALAASFGAVFFAARERARALTRTALVSSVVIALLATGQAVSVARQHSLLRLIWVKEHLEDRARYEKWNSFSRIRVSGDPNTPTAPSGWGLSTTIPASMTTRELELNIDASAATVLTAFDGNTSGLQYLRYDITNLAHSLRHDAHVLVIGSGGGRDILSALVFGQQSVVAVELNRDIIQAVNGRYGDFAGHLDRNPRVTFVNDEARSYIARQRARFDIIQASLIDTWAATAAGAFVLSENSLYTVEGWGLFLDRLTDRGLLTFSRFYSRERPAEVYRLAALASASLERAGVTNPRDHIIIARQMQRQQSNEAPDGVGTILVSRQAFSDQDTDTIERVVRAMGSDLVLSPRFSLDSTFAALASGKDLGLVTARYPLNIAPPTDDSPFFFHMLRLRDVFKSVLRNQGMNSHNANAVFVLGVLLIVVVALTLSCILLPLILTTKKAALEGAGPLFAFFASIGFGFMFVEISQMQRLIIFLGHPTYGLSVVLFALLLSSGLGSRLTQNVGHQSLAPAARLRFGLLLFAIVLFGALTPYAIREFQGATTMLRILVAIANLFPIGVLMGMAFPLGMRVASARFSALTPWLWGLNGATSVCASVLATAISLTASISASFWTGFAWYAVAFVALVWAAREPNASPLRSSMRLAGGRAAEANDGHLQPHPARDADAGRGAEAPLGPIARS